MKEKKDNKKYFELAGFLLLLLAVVIVIILLLRGKTITTGKYPEDVRNESFTCVAENLDYPVFGKINTKKSLKITSVFEGEDALQSLSLVYTLYYGSRQEVTASEAHNHAVLNKALGAAGFSASKFNYKFALFDDHLTLQLFASSSDIDEMAAKFLMIATNDEGKIDVKTLKEYVKNYESQGFTCETTL